MDANRFDVLARTLSAEVPRRGVLGGLLASVIAPLSRGRSANARARPAETTARAGGSSCALQVYKKAGTRFTGKRKIRADVQFLATLNKINACAEEADVFLKSGSTYRTQAEQDKTNPEVKNSNHVAGHAIDFTPQYRDAEGQLQTCGWVTITKCMNNHTNLPKKARQARCARGDGCLSKPFEKYPQPIKDFFTCINDLGGTATEGILWGGNHGKFDPIHIDDRINQKGLDDWRARAKAMEQSKPCGGGRTCNLTTGTCESTDREDCTKPGAKPCPDGQRCNSGTKACECTAAGSTYCGNGCCAPDTECCYYNSLGDWACIRPCTESCTECTPEPFAA